jgi:uncharacterized protein (DUF433 family)
MAARRRFLSSWKLVGAISRSPRRACVVRSRSASSPSGLVAPSLRSFCRCPTHPVLACASQLLIGEGWGRYPAAFRIGQTGEMAPDLLSRIVVDPAICFGKPTIRGHRIWVSLVLGYLAEGWTVETIVEEFPGIEPDDVRACIAYGARLADIRFADLDDVA